VFAIFPFEDLMTFVATLDICGLIYRLFLLLSLSAVSSVEVIGLMADF